MTQDAVLHLMQAHGLWLVGPMAVIEGPIVTVIAAYLAKLGYDWRRSVLLDRTPWPRDLA